MQMYFKTRNAARSVRSGKMQDNGLQPSNRWSRVVDIKKKEKQQTILKCVKDWRNIENAKNVQVLKVKKNKLI